MLVNVIKQTGKVLLRLKVESFFLFLGFSFSIIGSDVAVFAQTGPIVVVDDLRVKPQSFPLIGVEVFPNPVSDYLRIISRDTLVIHYVEVYSADCQALILSGKLVGGKLFVGHIRPGLYRLRIIAKDELEIMLKFMKR